MKRKSRSLISTIVALFLGGIAAGGVVSSMLEKPIKATYAEGGISYISRSWDDASKTVKSVEGGCSEYTIVESTTTNWTGGKWYVVNSDVTISSRVNVADTANLILCDGAKLTANGGISVNNGNTLNIYGQSEDSGSIIATASSKYSASIGGNEDRACGTIFIHGGNITATGPDNTSGAGIGGGFGGDGGNITIYGGNITANGGKFAAAIGGGIGRGAGTITIYGGNIVANGGPQGAGLGCGPDMGTDPEETQYPGGTITIHGGIINTIGGVYAAGIGGSIDDPAVTITINGGDITAIGGESAAGIGGGYYSCVGTVTINGGKVDATGGGNGAYGIGNGSEAINNGTLIVNNSDLNVIGNDSETPIFPRDIKTATEYQSNGWKYMIVDIFHTHKWSYSAEGNIIRATCSTEDCYVGEEERTLTLVANDSVYDGTAKTASFTSGYSQEAFGTPSISYFKNDVEVTECVSAGTYEARVTIGGVTAIKEFTIAQATPNPEVPTGLVATYGDKLSSVALPTNWAWKNPEDSVGNAGDRTHVAIYTPTDSNYKSVEKTITVSVSQATPTPEVPTGLVATYGDKLSSVTLPTNWSWKNPEDLVGDAGNREHIAIYTPTDPNYKSVEKTITVSVSQATPTPEVPTGLVATYGDKLSSVNLPANWAWKNPEDTVGNAGEREHIAIYTPTDPNYKSVEKTITVSVSQATPNPDIPTGLVATYGDKLSSVTLPANWAWKNPEDTVGNAGEREHIAIYTPTDPNYKAIEANIVISVSQATPTGYDIPTGLVATYGDTLSSITLPSGWSWKVPTDKVGDVGDRTHVAIYTPTDPNYKAIEANIIISVSQATPNPDIPTGLVATYGDKLSSVTLPANWAWKNPEDLVGDAGNREHIAIYTPTDPNYKAVENILTVAVAKANPSVPTLDTIEAPCGVALSTIELPDGFSWMDGAQKTSTLGENTFKARYTPVDTANYNVVENIDVKVNVKWVLVDPTQGSASVTINGDNEVYTADISVKVEVKTEVTVDEKRNEYASLATKDFVKPNEDIFGIYGVKLIRTTNGVEEEIQPSDIKPGTKITVFMAIPEELVDKDFRLLHIHNSDDITEVTNYAVSEDGKSLTVEVDRLSEFAFIGATDKDNGFIYNSTPVWALILLIIFSIILLVGIYYLYRLIKDRNDNSNNGDKLVKTMSVTFISPILLVYSGLNGIIIAFIIVAALSIIVWASNLYLFISNKKKKEKLIEANNSIKTKEDVKPVEEAINDSNEDEEETVTVTDAKGNIFQIRFIKSFTAKLIQAPEETKKYYEELKNEVLSYKKTTSRISWHFDSINSGRNQVLKFAVKGKTLCVYFSLNADDYAETKYKVEKVESKKYEDVPCLYRIKNDRRLGYAKDLIAKVAEKFGLVKGEEKHEVYANLPYEENKPLIERGLIKELKVQVNKPEEEVVETKVNAEGDEIVITKDSKGNMFEIRYVKSFTAKLSQSPDETKDYYSILKNYVLSYKGPHSRVSWHHDAINLGRDYIIKFAIRGKTLCVYFALDASKLDSKYKVEEAKGKRFEEVPVLYRIKNDRRLEYAKELIDMLMNNLGIQRGKELNDEYRIPFEETKVLLAKGLIKEVKTKVTPKEVMESVSVEEADKLMSDVKAEASIEEDNIHHRRQGLKDIINIDTLSKNYNDGDEVTLDSLIEKKLISPKVGYVKVLGRGILDKKLTVVLNDYSLQAVKMIVLTGGHAKKI